MKKITVIIDCDTEECSQYIQLHLLRTKLKQATDRLAEVIAANSSQPTLSLAKDSLMASPILQELTDQVNQTTSVIGSAVTLINGFSDRVQTAVDEALVNGATADELAPVTDVLSAMRNSSNELAAAVAANTPAAAATRK